MESKKVNVIILQGSFCIGGAENMVYELVKNLDKNEVNAIVISIHSRMNTSLEEKVDKAGIHVIYADCEGKVTIHKLLKVYQLIKSQKPDVIHAHLSGVVYGLLWTVIHRTKMIVTVHSTPDKAFSLQTSNLLKTFAKMNKVLMVGVSRSNQQLIKSYYGLTDKNVVFINNGIDLSRYYRKEHEGITLINVGRLDSDKNQQLIIKILARLHRSGRQVKLVICGDGPEMSNLRELAHTHGVENFVQFTGNVANTEDYLAVADIYIQSSHREGLPLSVIEAMASGLPIISTDVGGMRDIVNGNGCLVPDNDENALFDAVINLVDNNDYRMKCGEISLAIVKEFSAAKMASMYTQLYRR